MIVDASRMQPDMLPLMEYMNGDHKSGAVFGGSLSNPRMYRYLLWRSWEHGDGVVAFVGLNPSTADAENDDPTIRRVKGFAKSWGYGGVLMLNLWGLVTPSPRALRSHRDPLGDNPKWLHWGANQADRVIFAWGSFNEAIVRGYKISKMYDGWCLGTNRNGSPKHPLYIPSGTEPVIYKSVY